MMIAKGSTTAVYFLLVDAFDGVTGVGGISPVVMVAKPGGALSAAVGSTTEVGNGVYRYTPTTGETDTVGNLLLHATGAGALPADVTVDIGPANFGLLSIDANGQVPSSNMRGTDNALLAANHQSGVQSALTSFGAAKTSELPDEPDNSGIAAIKERTDRLQFDDVNKVQATGDWLTLGTENGDKTIGEQLQAAGAVDGNAIVDAVIAALSGSEITITGSVLEDGTIEIIQGDDYADADGRAVRFTISNYTGPSLSGATVTLAFVNEVEYQDTGDLSADLEVTSTDLTIDGATITIEVPLTAEETATLDPSPTKKRYNYFYQLRATLNGSGRKVTLLLGSANIRRAVLA